MSLSDFSSRFTNSTSLNSAEMETAIKDIIGGKATTTEIETFLLALRIKGETADEIAAAAGVMRAESIKLSKSYPDILDTCGTGGDAKNTLNISTLAALVASAAGARVAKHGNRSVSGICGSADLLEMLGVKIDLTPAQVQRCLDRTGFGFFFAPNFHPAMKAAMPARKNIPGKTLFNLLGPLTNPAGARYQLVGVYSQQLVEIFAQVLLKLGSKRAMVVHGLEGLDEISLSGPTKVAELNDEGDIRAYSIEPMDFGLKSAPLEHFFCKSTEDNKQKALKVLEGVAGPETDIVCLNAAAALYVSGVAPTLREGLVLAQKAIHSHLAMNKLDQIIECTNADKSDDSE